MSNKKGFDIVIGNPPWGQKAVKFRNSEKKIIKKIYKVASGLLDISKLFIERSYDLICDDDFCSFVLPDIILLKKYPKTRKFLLDYTKIYRIAHLGMPFRGVNLDVITLFYRKRQEPDYEISIEIYENGEEKQWKNTVTKQTFMDLQDHKFNIFLTEDKIKVIEKLRAMKTYSDYFHTHEGVHSGNVRDKIFLEEKKSENCKSFLHGSNTIDKYYLNWTGLYIDLGYELKRNEHAHFGSEGWYQNKKILIQRTGDDVIAMLDKEGYYCSNNLFVSVPHIQDTNLYLFIAILNSTVIKWWYRVTQPRVGRLFPEIKIYLIDNFSVFDTDDISEEDIEKITELVKERIYLEERNRNGSDVVEEIKTNDREINKLIFRLYNLTQEDIDIIRETIQTMF